VAALGQGAWLPILRRIEQIFPGLGGTEYLVTRPKDDASNWIAWAAHNTTGWWWPDESGHPDSSYWPAGVPRVETLEAFRDAFGTLGYVVCDDDQ
jgi:hypothetical protein